MSRETIQDLLEAEGSFPREPKVRANFEALFAMDQQGAESSADLAWGFRLALDQWSHVDAVVDAAVAERLRAWALARWEPASYAMCAELGGLLLNVATPATLSFLQAQHAAAANPDVQRLLGQLIEQHPQQD